MKLQEWLGKYGLLMRIENHGFTDDGWLWVADIIYGGKLIMIKNDPKDSMVQQIRGWGESPNEAVENWSKASEGRWLLLKNPDKTNKDILLEVPSFTI